MSITAKQRDALAESAYHGSTKEAGTCLGIAKSTVTNRLERLYANLGVETQAEALRAMGWLRVPTHSGPSLPSRPPRLLPWVR